MKNIWLEGDKQNQKLIHHCDNLNQQLINKL